MGPDLVDLVILIAGVAIGWFAHAKLKRGGM